MAPGQYMRTISPRLSPNDDTLPAKRDGEYATLYDNQGTLVIRIYQAVSDSHLCKEHTLVAEVPMEAPDDAKAGEPFTIEFIYDDSGVLDVRAYFRISPRTKSREV
jgi:molecular chaperone DnaK (HSP70)